jgi:hypothetical protein
MNWGVNSELCITNGRVPLPATLGDESHDSLKFYRDESFDSIDTN